MRSCVPPFEKLIVESCEGQCDDVLVLRDDLSSHDAQRRDTVVLSGRPQWRERTPERQPRLGQHGAEGHQGIMAPPSVEMWWHRSHFGGVRVCPLIHGLFGSVCTQEAFRAAGEDAR